MCLLGSVFCSTPVRIRYIKKWWALRLQVLPGHRRQSIGDTSEGTFRQSAQGETRIFTQGKVAGCLIGGTCAERFYQESKEAFFVALRRKPDAKSEGILKE